MFNPYFNNNFQANDFNPQATKMFGQGDTRPYVEGLGSMITPQPLPGSMNEQQLYPLESSTATPQFNQQPQNAYREGGLARAMTPRYKRGGVFRKPLKALKSVLGGGAGAIIGNMIAPGIGGIIGGALGQGAQHAIRGKSGLEGALKGAMMGAAVPSVASALGSGATHLGINGAGSALSDYGAKNAILPSLGGLGRFLGDNSGLGALGMGVAAGDSIDDQAAALNKQYSAQGNDDAARAFYIKKHGHPYEDGSASWLDKLTTNSKDFLSQPANLLSAGALANSLLNRPKAIKEKSPEQQADEAKRYRRSLMLSPAELAEQEAYELQLAQAGRRKERNKYLPEERLGTIAPRYTKTHSPEEYKKHGKWLSYYDNPQFSGAPLAFKKGGEVPMGLSVILASMSKPTQEGLGSYLNGITGGQDDKIPALLSDGEYVIDASTVSDLGDGNSAAGARKLDEMRENIMKHKRGGKIGLPPKAKSLADYLR